MAKTVNSHNFPCNMFLLLFADVSVWSKGSWSGGEVQMVEVIVEWHLWMWLLRYRNVKAQEKVTEHYWKLPSTPFPNCRHDYRGDIFRSQELFLEKRLLEFSEEQRMYKGE